MAWYSRKTSGRPVKTDPVVPARRPLAMALEPRVMFDGAAAATVAQFQPAPDVHAAALPQRDAGHEAVRHSPAAVLPHERALRAFQDPGERDGLVPAAAERNVVFVDARVEDSTSLLAQVRAGTEVVYLQQGRDGLEQMRDYLDAHPGVASVQIIAHGNDGDLWLGNTYLSADNIGQHAAELQQIGAGIEAGGDILIYACDTAAGDKGMAFVGALADLTHRDVAASSNRIGMGYDWNLEISTGSIEAVPVLSAAGEAGYQHDLAIITVTNAADAGAGSLRAAIASANATGDTITFSSGFDIKLAQHDAGDTLLLINKSLTIEGDINGDGVADVTLDGQYNGRVLEIASGATVKLDGLVIEHGLLSGDGGRGTSTNPSDLDGGDALGAGIRNAGTLTLSNVTVTGNRAAGGGGASYTPSSNPDGSAGGTVYGFGGGGGGGYAGIGGGDGGAASITGSGGAAATLGSGGVGGTGGQAFDYGGNGYGGGGGSTTGGTGAYQASTLGGGSGGTAGGIGGGGGGWGNTGGASGRGGNAVGGIYNAGTLTVLHSSITDNAAAGGGGAGPSYSSGLVYAAGAGGVAAGAILNTGTLRIDATTIASFSGNAAQGGERGQLGGSDPSHPAATSDADALDQSGGTTTTLPSVTGVSSSTANGTYGPGDVITITVTFSDAVNVTGTPQLTLETGSTDRVASYTGGSGTNTLTFSYTVQTGDSSADLDYENSGALALNGGTIKSAGGNDASLALASPGAAGSLGANKNIVIVPSLATITSATYDASTGVLTVTGADMTAGDTIDTSKLALTGQGGGSYTLTSGSVTAGSGTTFSVTLNAADRLAVNGLLNKNGTTAVDATLFNLAAAAGWDSSASAAADTGGNGVTVSNVTPPTITSATYDAGTHVLTVTGSGLVGTIGANNDITVSRLTLTGEGGVTYTLTSSNVEVTSATSFSVTLNAADRAQVERMFNKVGASSTGGTTYNLAAADDWDSVIGGFDIKDLANAVTVSNVATPAITSATYDASTGDLVVTGTGFLSLNGAANDIVASKFTFTGEGGQTYTLTDTADVDITSGTSFTLHLSLADRAAINQLANKDGTGSTGGTTYNLAAAEDWAAGADAAVAIADITGNGIAVSNVAVPSIIGASYDASTGTVVVTGTGFLSLNGAANDIVASKFTFTGEGGQTYTLTDTADVDIVSGSSFTLVLSAADKAAIDRIIDANGSASAGGTTYNLSAAEDWAAGADPAVVTADTTGNGLAASNVEATPVLTTSGGTSAFVEGNPTVVDGGLTVTDADDASLASATVRLTGGFHSGEDVLAFANDGSTMGNITASYDAGTGVMTLTSAGGTATLAQWQAALRSVTYQDTSQAPDTATRTISFTVNDGTRDSLAGTKAVSVTAVDDAPVLDPSVNGVGYTEGGAPVALEPGLTITDVDSSAFQGATVSIIDFRAGDVLAVGSPGSFTANYDAGTGVLTLTGTGTAAELQAALRSVTYSSTSDNPDAGGTDATRSINFVVTDDGGASGAANAQVLITPVNDAPVVTTDGGSAGFVAGDNVTSTPVAVDDGLTVSDVDDTSLASATVSITGNFHSGEDVLAFVNDGATMGNILASYDSTTGVLTLTSAGGTATKAQWQAALRSVTYTDTAITPDTATRTVSFTVNDGAADSTAATRTVTVTATDQTPIVTTTGGTTDYVGGTAAVTIDGGIVVTDRDNTTQSSGTVSISAGFHSGDILTFINTNSTAFGNILGSFNAATGVLTLTSSGATATDAQWANALSAVTFSASSSATPGHRTISFAISDGTKTSAVATDAVDVLGPPTITTDSGSASFVAGDNAPSTPVAIDSGLTVSDGANPTLASVTIAITGGFHAGEDVLLFANDGSTMGNITATYNASTGVLTLVSSGASATLAQWQSALESVRYTDTAVTPDTTTRTISFTAVDSGGVTSNTATRTITVTATDQTPIVTTTGGTTDYVYGTAPATIDGGITVSDLDNATQSSATVSIAAGFGSGDVLGFDNTNSALFGNIAASYNAATGVLTLTSSGATATDAQWANALSSVTFSSTSTSYGARTIAFATNDGSKASAVATDTVNLLGLPKVTDVSSTTPDGSYKVGDTIYLTVSFDQAVVVDATGGTPTLQMETGGVDRDAVYVSGSGSNTLTFAYTVQGGDATADLDYTSTAALSLDGGTIRSGAGVDAVLTLPAAGSAASVAGQHAIVVDGIAPTVVSVDVPANGTYVAGQNLDFTVNYSEAVTVDTSGGTPRVAITLDTGGTVYADYVSGSGTAALVFRYTVAAGQNDADGIVLPAAVDGNGGAIGDAVGNAAVDTLNGVAATTGVRVDAVAPTASIALSDTALKAGETATVTISFSEAVTGLTLADFTVDHGSLSGLATRDGGLTWTATFTPAADVTDAGNLIVLDNSGYADAAGNIGTGTTASPNYAIDTTRPTASIALSDTALKAGETATVTISFSEAVSGLSVADFTVDHGSLGGLATRDGGLTWTATFTPGTDVTDAGNLIVLDNTGYTDAAGNTGVGTTASPGYAIDTARPTASIALSDTALKIGETATVTITFNEAVSGLTVADFAVDHGSLSGLATRDGGLTWTATFTPSADVTAAGSLIRLDTAGVSDAAGNAGQAIVASAPYAVDTHAPRVVAIDRADASPNSGQGGLDYTVTFDEDVSGLDAADFTLATTGNVQAVIDGVTRVDGRTYTVHVAGVRGSGGLQLGLAAGGSGIADLAGNALAAGAQGQAYVVGGVSPTVLPPVAPAPIAPAAAHELAVSLLPTLSATDLPTMYYGDAAPPRTLEVPFDVGAGVLDALAGLATVPQGRGHGLWGAAWPDSLPIRPDTGFSVTLPAIDALEVLQVRAADGRPLPPWLVFDPVAGTLTGTPPRDYTGTLALLLTVRDGQHHIHEVPLQLSAAKTVESARNVRPAATAKPALAAQFGAQRHAGGDHAALLRQLAVAQRHAATAQVHP